MKKHSRIIKKLFKWGIIIVILVVGGTFLYQRFLSGKVSSTSAQTTTIKTAQVEMRTIENILSSSGTIQPLDSYEVSTLVEGEIIAADFEVGDTVQEGQVLYKINTDTLDSKISTAETAVERANKNYDKAEKSYQDALAAYDKAQADYNDASDEYSNLDVLSTETGIVKSVLVEVGDNVQKGSQIAQIYDNSKMLLVVPFNASEVDSSLVGKTAKVTINDSFETIKGKVTEVSSIEEAYSGNRVIKDVTIEVSNPGGITNTTAASASIGSIYSVDMGTFSVKTDAVITSDVTGEIASLNLQEGDSIKEGDVVLAISQKSVDDELANYLNAVDNAQNTVDNTKDALDEKQQAIEDADTNLQDVIDTKTDYTITAPVTGKVISKNMLKGETIDSSNFNSTLCTIYDLSSVTFEMYVDELDIKEVVVGQKVNVTADAFSGKEFTGTVTNVSLKSSTSGGVTQYPVTVRIDDVGDLLPGMNVTGNIVIDEAVNAIAIPSDALQRGDVVYVKDDTASTGTGSAQTADTSTAQGNATQGNTAQGNTAQGNAAQDNAAQGNAAQGNATQGNAAQGNTTQGNSTGPGNNVPDGYKAVTVTTGITDGDYIEITSGNLTEGDEIFLAYVTTSSSSGLEDLLSQFNMNNNQSQNTQQMPSGMSGGNFNSGGGNFNGGGNFSGGSGFPGN